MSSNCALTYETVKRLNSRAKKTLRNYAPPFINTAPQKIAAKMGFTTPAALQYAQDVAITVIRTVNPKDHRGIIDQINRFLCFCNPLDYKIELTSFAPIHLTLGLIYESLQNLRVLQLACNYGPYLHFLEHHEGAEVSGVDVAVEATQYAREHGLDVRQGSSNALPFVSNTFDLVITRHFLESQYLLRLWGLNRVQLDIATLKEIYRVLKPGGIYLSYLEDFELPDSIQASLKEFQLFPDSVTAAFSFPNDLMLFMKGGFPGLTADKHLPATETPRQTEPA